MAHISKTISDVMDSIKDQDYILPDIQRGYVWKAEQIENLFDSLLSGYPIGSFLFWKIKSDKVKEYNFYNFIKDYHPQKNNNSSLNPSGEKEFIAILDGQQRLTSIYIGLYGSYTEKKKGAKKNTVDPFIKKYLYLNLLYSPNTEEYNTNQYEFKFLSEKEAEQRLADDKNLWIKVRDILEKELSFFIIHHSDVKKLKDENKEKVYDLINNFKSKINSDPVINYYEENSQDLDKVLNIFVRVNSGGTELSYSDLLMSTISATWENKNAREEIEDLVFNINNLGFNINKDFIMKSSLMLADINVKFFVKNFVIDNMIKIEKLWETIRKYLILSFSILKYYGYSKEYISSYNAVLPIAYFLKTINASDNFIESNKDITCEILKWFRMSQIKQIFGGGSDNTLTKYREIIKNNGSNDFPLESIRAEFRGKRGDISLYKEDVIELVEKTDYKNTDKKLLFSVLSSIINIPNINDQITIDHLYPKSSFKEANIKSWGLDPDKVAKLVNNISNLQFLGASENSAKSAEDFKSWVEKKISNSKDYKIYNLIPDIDYKPENFILFCENRKELMISELCKKFNIK
ncbi:DUF262 domain-containing protein [Brachyspira sp. SAP_772]|uniref:DUF262 domain-containing protein n=1 Tax=Brachyspira sp. SAP_772 TaxID=2608385 RepID=UPI0012F49291|nr:DUF262 domain-containing protein [Brachyspira sp. SAP_772]